MIVVVFNPPLERKDYEWALPKVQATFPDWTWCSSTGTPEVREREGILTGALKGMGNEIGSLIYKKHYRSENECLMYSGTWSQADTDHYEVRGETVKVIDGWDLVKSEPLTDIDDIFKNMMGESTLKKIIKESIDEFEWTKGLSDYDIEGWYASEPVRRHSKLYGNLYDITLKDDNQVEVMLYHFSLNTPEEDIINNYLDYAKREMETKEYYKKKYSKSSNPHSHLADGPYYWDVQDVIDYIKEGYFIKLS